MGLIVREEGADDHAGVHAVHADAFGRVDEAEIVSALRPLGPPLVSLVVASDGRILGHVLFSRVRVGDSEPGAMALGPVGVLRSVQNRGIGCALIRAGLDACLELGEPLVCVLGHLDYYPRFGFEPAAPHGLYFGRDEPNPAFQLIELTPGALAGRRGEVRYLPPFYA